MSSLRAAIAVRPRVLDDRAVTLVTLAWTALALGGVPVLATGGGHPPAIILTPALAAAWLAGAVAIEGIAKAWNPQRSFHRSLAFVLTTHWLFLAFAASIVLRGVLQSSHRGFPWILVTTGPLTFVATAAALVELRRGRRLWPVSFLGIGAAVLFWASWRAGKVWIALPCAALGGLQVYAARSLVTGPRPAALDGRER